MLLRYTIADQDLSQSLRRGRAVTPAKTTGWSGFDTDTRRRYSVAQPGNIPAASSSDTQHLHWSMSGPPFPLDPWRFHTKENQNSVTLYMACITRPRGSCTEASCVDAFHWPPVTRHRGLATEWIAEADALRLLAGDGVPQLRARIAGPSRDVPQDQVNPARPRPPLG